MLNQLGWDGVKQEQKPLSVSGGCNLHIQLYFTKLAWAESDTLQATEAASSIALTTLMIFRASHGSVTNLHDKQYES